MWNIPHMPATTSELLTSSQVAKQLRVSLATVARMAADGRLDAQKLPGPRGAYLFTTDSVAAYKAAEDAKWGAA